MKNASLLILFSVIVLSSCSTIYQSGQTPDDVYYSPTREVKQYVNTQSTYEPYNNYEERQIRMNAYDPRWRYLDTYYNYDYRYSPYNYGYNYGYYYNPYYYNSPVYVKGVYITNPRNTTPRMTNLGSYQNNGLQVINSKNASAGYSGSYRNYNNSNSTNSRRSINTYSERNNTNSNRSYNSDRSYTPSSSSSSSSRSTSTPSSSSSSGSGSSVPRNSRGN